MTIRELSHWEGSAFSIFTSISVALAAASADIRAQVAFVFPWRCNEPRTRRNLRFAGP